MNQDVLEQILNSPSLPSLPAVAMRVLELSSDPDVKMADLASAISQDQAIAAKILRTVNSSFFGLREPCSSIEKALVLLGLSPVKSLVLGFSLVSCLEGGDDDDFDYVAYWKRGLYTGISGKLIAEAARNPKADEVFLAGLLQDVGMIAMFRALDKQYMSVIERTHGVHKSLAMEEIREFEIHHGDLGAMLCENWKLPQELTIPVKYHERSSAAPQAYKDLVRCVELGNVVHDALTSDEPAEHIHALYTRGKQWWSLTTDQVDEVIRNSTEAFAEIAGLFDVEVGTQADPDAMLEQAEKKMVELAKEQPRTSFAAAKLSEVMGDTGNDPLTGAVGKAGFDSAVRSAFTSAKNGDIELSLVQVLVDGLDTISAEHGAIVTDEVVLGTVVALQRFFEPIGGVICRIADPVFAVVLPQQSIASVEKAAEEFIARVEESWVHWMPEGVQRPSGFRITLGMAGIDTDNRESFDAPTDLIVAATRALQEARRNPGSSSQRYAPRAAA